MGSELLVLALVFPQAESPFTSVGGVGVGVCVCVCVKERERER